MRRNKYSIFLILLCIVCLFIVRGHNKKNREILSEFEAEIKESVKDKVYDWNEIPKPESWESIYVPEYMPEGYLWGSIEENNGHPLQFSSRKLEYIKIKFSNYNELKENDIYFTQWKKSDRTEAYIPKQETKNFTVNGWNILYEEKNKQKYYWWEDNQCIYLLEGNLENEELLKILESMKKV